VSEIRTDEVTVAPPTTEVAPPTTEAAPPTVEVASPSFAHESEVELARILDFYAVRWEYEPHTFPILWNLDGEVLESFSPDFYLPDLDLYVELTTLKQRLVRKKNRKLRRLRELYPEIRIKLFYARDFRALMLKYGKLVLADALSGSPGQVVPPRHRANPGPVASDGPRRAVVDDDVDAAKGRGRRRERRGRRSGGEPAVGAVVPTPVAAGQSEAAKKGARTQR
jgi:hypoxanthine phosphoribosyltransferase